MPIRRNGLGKGLDSLIPDKNSRSGKNESKSDKVLKKELSYSEEKKELNNMTLPQEEHQKKDEKADLTFSTDLNENKKIIDKHEENRGELLLNINEVEPNRNQPRKEFDEDALLELADSVKQYGILQPLIVQKLSLIHI